MNKDQIKKKLLKNLQKIKAKEEQIADLLNDLEGLTEELNGEKPLETNYGTSCVRLENKKGALLTEY